jgi:predicted CXXCH cytochrome family protein
MPQLFPRWSNTAWRVALATAGVGLTALVAAPMVYVRTSYGQYRGEPLEQPVEFDHRHHVRDNGIECLYCHHQAETDEQAGIPSTSVCMGCHNQVWPDSEQLAPVRASALSGRPIAWKRVYTLPDFVYFHHGVHVQAGVACARCHGAVDQEARLSRATPLTMDFCLDCHRHPPGRADTGRAVTSLTTCSACHR